MVRSFTTSKGYYKCKHICRRMILDLQVTQNSPISSSRDCSLVPLVLPSQLPPTSDYSDDDDDDQVRDRWPYQTDEFSEKFQKAFDPTDNFRNVMLQFFLLQFFCLIALFKGPKSAT